MEFIETVKKLYALLYGWTGVIYDRGVFLCIAPCCLLLESYVTYVCIVRLSDEVSKNKKKKITRMFWAITMLKFGFYLLILWEYLGGNHTIFWGKSASIVPLYYLYTLVLLVGYAYYLINNYLFSKRVNGE